MVPLWGGSSGVLGEAARFLFFGAHPLDLGREWWLDFSPVGTIVVGSASCPLEWSAGAGKNGATDNTADAAQSTLCQRATDTDQSKLGRT